VNARTGGEQLAELAERKRNEEVLRQAAENHRLARAVASASDGVLITDPTLPDNPIIYTNPATSRITGYQPDEIIGHNCRFLQGPEQILKRSLKFALALSNNER